MCHLIHIEELRFVSNKMSKDVTRKGVMTKEFLLSRGRRSHRLLPEDTAAEVNKS